MKTKFVKPIIMAALAVAAVSSCNKESRPDAPASESGKDVSLVVSFTNGIINAGDFTKVTGALADREAAECKYNNVQVFVFNEDGQVDNSKRYISGTLSAGSWQMPEPMKCTTGKKDVWVLVNFPTDYTVAADVNSKADLMSKTYRLESINTDGTVANIIMTGHKETEFTATQASAYELLLSVSRSVCAITLEKVVNVMENALYRDKVVLKRAYIMQVPGIQKVDGSVLASASDFDYSYWYARHTAESSVIFTDGLSDAVVAYGEDKAYTTLHSFYSFPNDMGGFAFGGDKNEALLNDGTDKKSNSYLVVEATVNGKLYAYPIILPKTEANKKYNVTLQIAHLGQDPNTPWDLVDFTDFQPKITVEAWDSKTYVEKI